MLSITKKLSPGYILTIGLTLFLNIAIAENFVPQENQTVMLTARLQSDSSHLDLSILKKGQNKMRLTVKAEGIQSGKIVHIYKDGTITELWETIDGFETQDSEKVEKATSFVDLFSLTPDYHLKKRSDILDKERLLQDFHAVLVSETQVDAGQEVQVPRRLILSGKKNDQIFTIRTIDFISFYDSKDPFLQPKELDFTNHITGQTGRVTIKSFSYNVGVPDFLFESGSTSSF